MSDTTPFGFGRFVPGFDFLQNLAKGAAAGMPAMPAALSGWVGLRAAQGRALASGIYLFAYYMGSSLLGTVSGLAWGQGAWLAVAGFLAVLLGLALLIVWRLRQQVRTTLTQVGA